jgi:hypothetical protein
MNVSIFWDTAPSSVLKISIVYFQLTTRRHVPEDEALKLKKKKKRNQSLSRLEHDAPPLRRPSD